MSASAALLLLAGGAVDGAALARACEGRDGWTDPAPPARIFGNVYDVGTCGIVALLVTGPEGHVLIDAGPAAAVPLVAANIERAGFRLADVRYLLSGHEHHDHAGGFAELQRQTGATLIARNVARPTLEGARGDPADPQLAMLDRFPAARVGRIVADGDRVTLGPLTMTAHATPGHSPGSTSWTWRSCDTRRCVRFVYGDSLSAIASDAYRFTDHPAYVAMFHASIAKVGALPCDLLVTPHPAASDLYPRLAGKAPLIDRDGCRHYTARSARALDERLASEAR